MESFPVCEHLSSLTVELQIVREFFDFLVEEGYFICKDVEHDDEECSFVPISDDAIALFYKMHNISATELEIERRRLLEIASEGG